MKTGDEMDESTGMLFAEHEPHHGESDEPEGEGSNR